MLSPLTDDAMALVSAPLRYRLAAMLTPLPDGGAKASVARPSMDSHPRLRQCGQTIADRLDDLPLHGYDSLESTLKILVEHGVDPEHPAYCRCLDRLLNLAPGSPGLYRGIGRPGRFLDEANCGGSMMIRAAVLARAGLADESLLAGEIEQALAAFASLNGQIEREQLTEERGGKYIVRHGLQFPSYYHLQLLAFTRSWRRPAIIARLRRAAELLIAWAMPQTYIRKGSQLIAMASLRPTLWPVPAAIVSDAERVIWIDQLIMLGLAEAVPPSLARDLVPQLPELYGRWIEQIVNTQGFLKWGAYTGLGLEPDWRSPKRKAVDLWLRFKQVEILLGGTDRSSPSGPSDWQ